MTSLVLSFLSFDIVLYQQINSCFDMAFVSDTHIVGSILRGCQRTIYFISLAHAQHTKFMFSITNPVLFTLILE